MTQARSARSSALSISLVLLALPAATALFACGSDGSLFGSGSGSGNGNGNTETGGAGAFSNDPIGTNAACVTSEKNATLPAVNLIIMYDKSGSMGDPAEGGDPSLKWVPVNTGMKAFFGDPASSAYNAALNFFPAPGNIDQTCAAPYAEPLVELTPLSHPAPLDQALDDASPQGGTPTLPALQGAIAYASKIITQRPDEKTVVVLVTDGEPGLIVNGTFQDGCSDNDTQHVAAAAAAAFTGTPSIPTYVIGVGQQLTDLNTIAQSGGTTQAFIVDVNDPSTTTTQLQAAFNSIRSQQKVSCNFAIPAPPNGSQLDKNAVNVAFTAGSGQETPLVYSADCSAQNGWRYNDPNDPTTIELCAATCASAQTDPNGKITLAFGCKTNVQVQ